MRIRIQHHTRYGYEGPVLLGPHVIRLCPAQHTSAEVMSYALNVGEDVVVHWQYDPWGNRVARLTFPKEVKTEELSLTVDLAVEIRPVNPFDFFVDDRVRELPFRWVDGFDQELAPFLSSDAPSDALLAFMEDLTATGPTIEFLVKLNAKVASRINYIIREEAGIQTSDETLRIGSGSCRDSALLLVDLLRAYGFASRFVSGYLVQLADDGIIPDMAKGVSSDVVDLHAWAEVYIPGAGWIGLDGTSGLLCGEGHIPLAAAVDPTHASPVSGTSDKPAQAFQVSMSVHRLGHEPSPRKPYSEEEWLSIVESGRAIDRALSASGIRLTSGGEPTWTSREHPGEKEWQTGAVGPTKWNQAMRFAQELRKRFGQGALLMTRMGKLYPGESLPRWAIDLVWRKDQVPVWQEESLLAFQPPRDFGSAERAPSVDDARRLAELLSEQLKLDAEPIAGYEDPWHFLRQEQNLPKDVDPLDVELDDPEERQRLARVLDQGLVEPVGWALPVTRGVHGWRSVKWTFRRDRMYLIPGDSPMGLRMPLERLGAAPDFNWVQDPALIERAYQFDPRDSRTHQWPNDERPDLPQLSLNEAMAPYQDAVDRTAIVVEARERALWVFLPPVGHGEMFLRTVHMIEECAKKLGQPVRIEGYRPPPDHRLTGFTITPDPGVIEVNLPVTASMEAYFSVVEKVADAANHAGLTTQKFQLDGREAGSGGGNHITLGGATPVESPWLNRPQLLGAMLNYLQHHPSLSYLFTGLFIGPTSQAPRLDEGRHDALDELELAMSRLPPEGMTIQPWLIDRMFRNLVMDVAGNTHRTEVCIDKLFDPHNALGRLGLLEFRAFEMPPHPRMVGVQMLLMRGLVAMLAKTGYRRPLIRWGSQLHDRFMLPHYLWADFVSIIEDMKRAGLPMEASWFQPFLDFRFPVAGKMDVADFSVEVRNAAEPWPTLGEEPAGPVVARHVDSSLERIQVRVEGAFGDRHAVAVNGVRLPLRPTGKAGEAVCGVRFRAWQPPFCLHPTIGVHHPLRFDVVDTWAERSLGACTYHVFHPEGHGFDQAPLTIFEAAARRSQRFTKLDHTAWPVRLIAPPERPNQPHTLDLRWVGIDRRLRSEG